MIKVMYIYIKIQYYMYMCEFVSFDFFSLSFFNLGFRSQMGEYGV